MRVMTRTTLVRATPSQQSDVRPALLALDQLDTLNPALTGTKAAALARAGAAGLPTVYATVVPARL